MPRPSNRGLFFACFSQTSLLCCNAVWIAPRFCNAVRSALRFAVTLSKRRRLRRHPVVGGADFLRCRPVGVGDCCIAMRKTPPVVASSSRSIQSPRYSWRRRTWHPSRCCRLHRYADNVFCRSAVPSEPWSAALLSQRFHCGGIELRNAVWKTKE